MQWYYVLVLVFSFFVFLLTFPMLFRVRWSFDVFENLGAVSICLFGIKIKSFQFAFLKNGILLIFKKIAIEKKFEFEKLKFLMSAFWLIFLQTKIFQVELYSEFGLKQNAGAVAIANGFFALFVNFFLNFLHTKKRVNKTSYFFEPVFNKNSACFCGKIVFCFAFISILTSFLVAKNKRRLKK